MKVLYIITDGKYYKIWFSSNIDKRLLQIQTWNSNKIKFVKWYQTKYAHRIEKELHTIFRNKKIKGEWFDLNLKDIDFIDKYLKKNADTYIPYKKIDNKKFMKKWTDRKLNIAIKKELSPLWKEMLFDILDYVDDDNIINFKILANDYWYSPSKISKAKSILEDKGIIKKSDWLYYLSPIVWISQKEISQELIHLFKDSFEKYNVEINLK